MLSTNVGFEADLIQERGFKELEERVYKADQEDRTDKMDKEVVDKTDKVDKEVVGGWKSW